MEKNSNKHYGNRTDYVFPSLDLLLNPETNFVSDEIIVYQGIVKSRIQEVIKDFGVQILDIYISTGPAFTLYEIITAPIISIMPFRKLIDDIELLLRPYNARIIAPIPGKGTIGVLIPNNSSQKLSLKVLLDSKEFKECEYELPIAVGMNLNNEVVVADLVKLPHLLVVGATGQGKSVFLCSVIASLLFKKYPDELKFVLIDPKKVEFGLFGNLRNHFLTWVGDSKDAIVSDIDMTKRTLNALCDEMENRYDLLRETHLRSIQDYNNKLSQGIIKGDKGYEHIPYIMVLIDEFADLMMSGGKAIEISICRLAQKARSVGIHLIIATQRPSRNVITSLIKANFPSRIAFKVALQAESKTIIDSSGAEHLIGPGEMLFSNIGDIKRVQCAYIDSEEIDSIVNTIASQTEIADKYVLRESSREKSFITTPAKTEVFHGSSFFQDPLLKEAALLFCADDSNVSITALQRTFSIGFRRANRIMKQLESAGIIGASKCKLLVNITQLKKILYRKS